jgi:pimeloyl-ACP methyl ester carboxylesterase
MEPYRVILLPGSVLPADLAYRALIQALGPEVQAVAKDLELYKTDEPPADWTLDTEVDGVQREADERGWQTFHLVGYSGGGAVALAFAPNIPTGCKAWPCWSPPGRATGTGALRTRVTGSSTRSWRPFLPSSSCPPSCVCR